MIREPSKPRADWRARCEAVGFGYHSIGGTYWDETACYRLTADEVDVLEAATTELHEMCLEACDFIVRRGRFAEFAIPARFHDLVAHSWLERDFSVLGRFDLAWTGIGPPKMLEYNADTPTALLEASVVQWHWMQEARAGTDQFNSIHERLIDHWKRLPAASAGTSRVHFAAVRESGEDWGNVEYLRDTAVQAGLDTRTIAVEDIGWDYARRLWIDLDNKPIGTLFKLYPWEWLLGEDFGVNLSIADCRMIEPAWKMMLSNKAILPILWELFPAHPNLLPAYRDPARLTGDYVRKPLLSREGANVALRRAAGAMISEGTYGAEGYVYQGYTPLYESDGNHAVIGAWIIGGEAAGIGIREDASPITRDTSRFVPHYFT